MMLMQKPDTETQQRAYELNEKVKRMLSNVNDPLQELNLINTTQRLAWPITLKQSVQARYFRCTMPIVMGSMLAMI